jgi:RNA polymerase sigma-70 factor (ECF subfamily)
MHEVRNETSDTAVIQEILGGNVNAFELLMDRYQGFVASIVTKHVPRASVQEVAHESFVRAYRSLDTFQARRPFKHWLSRVAVRCCYDFWREHYRNREVPISSIPEEAHPWIESLLADRSDGSPDGNAQNREALGLLRWAMDRLSVEDRMVLALVHLEEHTTAEAADLLHWSVPKVKIRAHRARKKLRKTLADAIPGRKEG